MSTAVMIMPGVQNRCSVVLAERYLLGCRCSPLARHRWSARRAPSACIASMVQALMAVPSTWTTPQPHCEVSAADMGDGQPQGFAQQLHQQRARLDRWR